MYLNNFSVRVPEGTEVPGGYVRMNHNTTFTIVLGNKRYEHASAVLYVDGERIGDFKVPAKSSIRLERPINKAKKFTFYKLGTPEATKTGLDGSSPDLGLIRVVFTPEERAHWTYTYTPPVFRYVDTACYASDRLESTSGGAQSLTTSNAKGMSAGGVGLSGHSDQEFVNAHLGALDYSQQTTIHLRLVYDENGDPEPLTSFSTPVPPRV
jgi:hypothetical protein